MDKALQTQSSCVTMEGMHELVPGGLKEGFVGARRKFVTGVALTCKTRNYITKWSPQTALWSEDRGSCPKNSDWKHTAFAFFKERALWSRRRLIDAPWNPSRTAAGLSGALGTLGGCNRL